ncbi:hypothetical protein GGX14DRAFT_396749 [Mycena pura]|uniref:Uncharacterized protein n=1 Tax=Mycena pura TaxID=153505 RepID=A0AAD6YB48_9AGAR|nr:hypothetical protein GGX14DRAFT_396749 [Mycena pura]
MAIFAIIPSVAAATLRSTAAVAEGPAFVVHAAAALEVGEGGLDMGVGSPQVLVHAVKCLTSGILEHGHGFCVRAAPASRRAPQNTPIHADHSINCLRPTAGLKHECAQGERGPGVLEGLLRGHVGVESFVVVADVLNNKFVRVDVVHITYGGLAGWGGSVVVTPESSKGRSESGASNEVHKRRGAGVRGVGGLGADVNLGYVDIDLVSDCSAEVRNSLNGVPARTRQMGQYTGAMHLMVLAPLEVPLVTDSGQKVIARVGENGPPVVGV